MSSSPMRKAKKRASSTNRYLFWSGVLCSPWLCWVCYQLLVDYKSAIVTKPSSLVNPSGHAEPSPVQTIKYSYPSATSTLFMSNSSYLSHALDDTIGVIIPVTVESVSHLETVLFPFMSNSFRVSQIVVLCAQDAFQRARNILRLGLFTSEDMNHAEFVLLPWAGDSSYVTAALSAVSQITADRIVLLTEQGLQDVNHHIWNLFLSGVSSLPFGPRGFVLSDGVKCLTPWKAAQPASFLVPPFVLPSAILREVERIHSSNTWMAFGDSVAQWSGNGVGGVVLAAEGNISWCPHAPNKVAATRTVNSSNLIDQEDKLHRDRFVQISEFEVANNTTVPSITLFLPDLEDLRAFANTICRFQTNDSQIHLFLYEQDTGHGGPPQGSTSYTASENCVLQYQTHHHGGPLQTVSSWLRGITSTLDVVITIAEDDSFSRAISTSVLNYRHSTLIRLPRRDLKYCDWMGSLTVRELRNWHIPQVDVAVITNDRPHSLTRLLASITDAHYFGDTLNLRINLEQDSDPETLLIVDKLRWDHGAIFVNHRVIHGGLLPAVVESWYPHSVNSYGLILEDDVELSPLFYAWTKMTLLRYRYGEDENKSDRLFGVSLYQQKNIETKAGGRQPFNARTIFAAENFANYDSPYLSQIPCSWGAIYFPEHWREFHSYLAVRLSEMSISIDQVVVPDARSNRWTKSWKKYFIELAFLRGYVMLYPNYNHFVSLSTNHLEVGSHVKDIPRDSYLQKRETFLVPLIPSSAQGLSMLLDLPGQRLPPYESLPILDLFGDIASSKSLDERGFSRRASLFPSCTLTRGLTRAHDVRDLFCL